MQFIDSHCHINFEQFAGQQSDLLSRMHEVHVSHALCISVDLPSLPSVLQLAEQHDALFASVGVHPDYEDTPEPSVEDLMQLSQHPKVIAIGETGLDYYRLTNDVASDNLAWQRERFRRHIQAARATNKPLIVHTRNSAQDTIDILRDESAYQVGGVMHCFTETLEVALAAIEQNFYISFSGIITFKSATQIQAVAQAIPLERILIETDSPYLAPVPHRGKTNEPSFVPFVAAKIAELRGISVEVVAQQTTQNFMDLFKVNCPPRISC
jgi:TatD DNase family protein